jgi:hypothetical protein
MGQVVTLKRRRLLAMKAMNRVLLLMALTLVCTNLYAKEGSKYKSAVVTPVTVIEGVESPGNADLTVATPMVTEELRTQLEKKNIAEQILDEYANVSEADAADSIVVDVKITGFKKHGGFFSHTMMTVEINIVHRKTRVMVASDTTSLKMKSSSFKSDDRFARAASAVLTEEIYRLLK